MADYGQMLLGVLRDQRKYYVRNADGCRIITDQLMYNACEDEALRLQCKVGAENKRKSKIDLNEETAAHVAVCDLCKLGLNCVTKNRLDVKMGKLLTGAEGRLKWKRKIQAI